MRCGPSPATAAAAGQETLLSEVTPADRPISMIQTQRAAPVLWEIKHHTSYGYDSPVFLEPQTLRLKPVTDASQRLQSFSLSISPEPTGRTDNVDLDGNEVTIIWFEAPVDHLDIEAISIVETLRPNPFDFLWLGNNRLPIWYDDDVVPALSAYRASEFAEPVRRFGEEVASAVGGDAQKFLTALTRRLHLSCRQVIRAEGPPRSGSETLRRKEGSCRDMTMLFLEIARSQGFGGRFVTGYHDPNEAENHELHAWPEVYVPGGGWRGYDPTTGLAVADRHIAVARSAHPENAMTVSGSYRGRTKGKLVATVSIHAL